MRFHTHKGSNTPSKNACDIYPPPLGGFFTAKANNSIIAFLWPILSAMRSPTSNSKLEYTFQRHAPKGNCGSHNRFVSTSTRHLLQKECRQSSMRGSWRRPRHTAQLSLSSTCSSRRFASMSKIGKDRPNSLSFSDPIGLLYMRSQLRESNWRFLYIMTFKWRNESPTYFESFYKQFSGRNHGNTDMSRDYWISDRGTHMTQLFCIDHR